MKKFKRFMDSLAIAKAAREGKTINTLKDGSYEIIINR